jgi:hypothetical protein
VNRIASVHCARSNGAYGREHILDAVIELSKQCALVLMSPFALGDVNANAHHSLWSTVTPVRNETAFLDPSNLAAAAVYSVLDTVFVPPLAEGAPLGCLDLSTVIGVYTGVPLAARYLCRPLREPVNGCIALRDLHLLGVNVEGETTDKSGLARQLQLHRALA